MAELRGLRVVDGLELPRDYREALRPGELVEEAFSIVTSDRIDQFWRDGYVPRVRVMSVEQATAVRARRPGNLTGCRRPPRTPRP